MSRIIQQPKKTLLQFPGLWLPGSPLPGTLGFGRRCCCGETCCSSPVDVECCNPPNSLIVDFGVGGWSNEGCNFCENIADEFILGPSGCLSPSPDDVCQGLCYKDTDGECKLIIDWLNATGTGASGEWYNELLLDIFTGESLDNPDSLSYVVYETSTTSTSDDCRDLFSGDPGVQTLTKVVESHFPGSGNPCSGTLPSTVTVTIDS